MIEELVKRASVVSTKTEKPRGSPLASLKSRLSTRERRFLHRLDRTDVEAASLVGSRERILPRTSSGRVLMESLEVVETLWADMGLWFVVTYPMRNSIKVTSSDIYVCLNPTNSDKEKGSRDICQRL